MITTNEILAEIRSIITKDNSTLKTAHIMLDRYRRNVLAYQENMRTKLGEMSTWDSSDELTVMLVQLQKAEESLALVNIVFQVYYSINLQELTIA